MLVHHELKPWRVRRWMSPKVERDKAFLAQVETICGLSTRPLQPHEAVLCVDDKTSLWPHPRVSPTTPAAPGRPMRGEHE
ncbi:MAG: hypothetical protein FJ137_00415 [Deltaproteobacteria bacterium]|nr:hypothetical protein [Deltaproteobacteria bacterium]